MNKRKKITLSIQKKVITGLTGSKIRGGSTAMLSSCGCGSSGCAPNTESACKCL